MEEVGTGYQHSAASGAARHDAVSLQTDPMPAGSRPFLYRVAGWRLVYTVSAVGSAHASRMLAIGRAILSFSELDVCSKLID